MLCVVNLVYLPRGLGLPRASKGQHPPDPHSTREKRHSLDATWLSCHVGQLADNVARHARFFRRSSDLRWSRERASAGSTCSPRSSAAKRRPSSLLNSPSWAARACSCSSKRRRASLTTSLAEL